MRYRSVFSKTIAMRFTGNLDLHRALERLMRRANLPLAYSQGFNPRPKITLASALPLGYTSESEVMDFWLKEPLKPEEILETLIAYSPPGIIFHSVDEVEMSAKKLQVAIQSAEYEIMLSCITKELGENVTEILAQETIMLTKKRKGKTKSYDLRPLLLDMTINETHLLMHLMSKEGATGRPDIVLNELGIDPFDVIVHRKKINFQE